MTPDEARRRREAARSRSGETSVTVPRGSVPFNTVTLGIFMVAALALVGFYFAQYIPAREVAGAGGGVSAARASAINVKGRKPSVRGLRFMPPRVKNTAKERATLLEGMRGLGLLRGYSMPPDRLVFLANGKAQYLPASPWPSGPVPGRSVFRGNTLKPRVALTFDDAYSGSTKLISLLVELRVPATIFPAGGAVLASPSVIKKAREYGFEIANHSTTHPTFTKIPEAAIVREVLGCDAAVRKATGSGTVAYFRPPGGAVDARVNQVLGSIGYISIMWSHDTIDWSPATTADQLYARATQGVRNGDIILMHSQGQYTCQMLPGIVKALRDKGFELTTISGILSND